MWFLLNCNNLYSFLQASKAEHHYPFSSQTVLNDQDVAKCEDLDFAYAAATYDGRLDWQPSLPSDSSASSSVYSFEMVKAESQEEENFPYARRPSCSIVERLLNRSRSGGSDGSPWTRKRSHRNFQRYSENCPRSHASVGVVDAPNFNFCSTTADLPGLTFHPNQSSSIAMLPNPNSNPSVCFMSHSPGPVVNNVLREHNFNFPYCTQSMFDNCSIPMPPVMVPATTSRSRHSTGNSSSSTSVPPFCPSAQFPNVSTPTLTCAPNVNVQSPSVDHMKPIVSMK